MILIIITINFVAAIEVILLARIGGAHTDTEKDIAKASLNITLQYAYSLVLVALAVVINAVGVFLAGYGACKQKKAAESDNTFTNIQSVSDIESNPEVQIPVRQLSPGSYSGHNLKGLDAIPEEPQTTNKNKRPKTSTSDESDDT